MGHKKTDNRSLCALAHEIIGGYVVRGSLQGRDKDAEERDKVNSVSGNQDAGENHQKPVEEAHLEEKEAPRRTRVNWLVG